MPLNRNLPRLDKRNMRVEFLCQFKVDKNSNIFKDSIFFNKFLLNAILLFFNQLKVQLFGVLFISMHFLDCGLNRDNALIELFI